MTWFWTETHCEATCSLPTSSVKIQIMMYRASLDRLEVQQKSHSRGVTYVSEWVSHTLGELDSATFVPQL